MVVSTIANDFRASASFAHDDEDDLFRKLAKAIERNTNAVFIEETHGPTKYNVAFDLTTGGDTRCEIADLLIVSKSPHFPFLRATFWQAKKEKKSKWISLGATDRHVDFKGQFNQWDLLSRRPEVSGIAPFNPPKDILSGFDSASIGSFGVFYERISRIEVVYSIAELITCMNPKTKFPRMVANAYLEKYFYMNGEALVRTSLESFLQSLFEHQIGAPLKTNQATHRWLASYVKAKVASSNRDAPNGFFDGFDIPENPDVSGDSDGVSILLVDSSNAA